MKHNTLHLQKPLSINFHDWFSSIDFSLHRFDIAIHSWKANQVCEVFLPLNIYTQALIDDVTPAAAVKQPVMAITCALVL